MTNLLDLPFTLMFSINILLNLNIAVETEENNITYDRVEISKIYLSTWFWISVFALFMSGITDGISMVIRQTILQLYTPDNMRGRVSAVNSIFIGSSNELGAFESGFTAKIMGTVTAVVFGGTMTLVTVTLTGICSPALRNLDFKEELEKNEAA